MNCNRDHLALNMQLQRTLGLILTITLSIVPTRAEPTCNNGGKVYCCQAAVAGDTKLIQFAADLAKYELDRNDVTCVLTRPASEDCPGVYACCQETLDIINVALYCQKPSN